MKPDIFSYLDYRQYLFDIIVFQRQHLPGFSFRAVAQCIGSRSHAFMRKIIRRNLDLNRTCVPALSKYFRLKKNEQEYFQSIVAFDQARKVKEKERLLGRMLDLRQCQVIRYLSEKQYAYFSRWYMPVVRELVASRGYNDDPRWIADRIIPPVGVKKIVHALKLLASLKLISRDGKTGKWKLTDRVISSSPEVRSSAAIKYHYDAITLGREAIRRFESGRRDIRSVTLALSPAGFRAMKKRLRAFWREVLTEAGMQKKTDRVYTVNTQLFPVTMPEKELTP